MTDEQTAVRLAQEIGFPVLVKASAGGGGRGMRVALNELVLKMALQQARAEAEAAFGDGSIYLEKYIEHPRHVEVQVLADLHGNAIHLWERDCSTQRRHQKLIEESPSPRLAPETRRAICESAVRLVKTAGYSNAGTVEFIVDQTGNFYFIEVNARIQVEHPVTELVTGIDLIKAQIRVASGEPLWLRQEDVVCRGAAIECRINAEDPTKNFQPSPGKIERLMVPGGFGVRFDSHAHPGYTVSPHYDSMIGKLLVHQPTRAEAIESMQRRCPSCESKESKQPFLCTANLGAFGVCRGADRHDVCRTNGPVVRAALGSSPDHHARGSPSRSRTRPLSRGCRIAVEYAQPGFIGHTAYVPLASSQDSHALSPRGHSVRRRPRAGGQRGHLDRGQFVFTQRD